MTSKDIFDLEEPSALIRKALSQLEPIDLSKLDTPHYIVPSDFTAYEVPFSKATDSEILKFLTPLIEPFEQKGLATGIYTAVHEAIRNAHQHGNRYDLKKKVLLYIKQDNNPLEFMIQDQGGIIDHVFGSYILKQREEQFREHPKFLNFYDFAQMPKPKPNLGTGTSFIFQYAADVRYYRSIDNGLIVHIISQKF